MEQYRVIKLLGRGSYGEALLVQDQAHERYVIKRLECKKAEFANEVRVLASLRHPFIVSFREAFVDCSQGVQERLCIVMEYADEGDLSAHIKRAKLANKKIEENLLVHVVAQVALALEYMHRKGVIYRDLKPANVLLKKYDVSSPEAAALDGTTVLEPTNVVVKLGDFGISKVLGGEMFACTNIGTPFYMAPEICEGRPHTVASDIWTLGILIFEMATLRVPFDGTNLKMLMHRICTAAIPGLPFSTGPDLRKLHAHCLQRDFTRRPSATDVTNNAAVRLAILKMAQQLR